MWLQRRAYLLQTLLVRNVGSEMTKKKRPGTTELVFKIVFMVRTFLYCTALPRVAKQVKLIPTILWNTKVHYRAYKSPPVDRVISQISPVHILTSHFFNIIFYNEWNFVLRGQLILKFIILMIPVEEERLWNSPLCWFPPPTAHSSGNVRVTKFHTHK